VNFPEPRKVRRAPRRRDRQRLGQQAERGQVVAVSHQPGGTYNASADWYLIGGDESALPAIGTILEALPAACSAHVFVEAANKTEELTKIRLVGRGCTTAAHRMSGEGWSRRCRSFRSRMVTVACGSVAKPVSCAISAATC
jgi:hypothetical protein